MTELKTLINLLDSKLRGDDELADMIDKYILQLRDMGYKIKSNCIIRNPESTFSGNMFKQVLVMEKV